MNFLENRIQIRPIRVHIIILLLALSIMLLISPSASRAQDFSGITIHFQGTDSTHVSFRSTDYCATTYK